MSLPSCGFDAQRKERFARMFPNDFLFLVNIIASMTKRRRNESSHRRCTILPGTGCGILAMGRTGTLVFE